MWQGSNRQKTEKSLRFRSSTLSSASRRYENPFFKEERRPPAQVIVSKLRQYLIWFGLLLVSTILLVLWLIFYSPIFQIKTIEVSGHERINKEEISGLVRAYLDERYFSFWPRKNYFTLDNDSVGELINAKYFLNSVNIKTKFPNQLNVEIIEKQYAYAWVEGDKAYFLDSDANILGEGSQDEARGRDIAILKLQGSSRIQDKKVDLDKKYLTGADYLIERLGSDFALKIQAFNVDIANEALKALPESNPELIFNPLLDLERQLKKLKIVRDERLKDDFSKKTYIDLKIGDSVYIR